MKEKRKETLVEIRKWKSYSFVLRPKNRIKYKIEDKLTRGMITSVISYLPNKRYDGNTRRNQKCSLQQVIIKCGLRF